MPQGQNRTESGFGWIDRFSSEPRVVSVDCIELIWVSSDGLKSREIVPLCHRSANPINFAALSPEGSGTCLNELQICRKVTQSAEFKHHVDLVRWASSFNQCWPGRDASQNSLFYHTVLLPSRDISQQVQLQSINTAGPKGPYFPNEVFLSLGYFARCLSR